MNIKMKNGNKNKNKMNIEMNLMDVQKWEYRNDMIKSKLGKLYIKEKKQLEHHRLFCCDTQETRAHKLLIGFVNEFMSFKFH